MDTVRSNLNQVDGIVEAVTKTKGIVQARLFDHLDMAEYELVVLGSDD